MGTFTHPITLIGPTGARETLEAVVDTDTMFAVFPAPVLERLGVEADRTLRGRRLGPVRAELDGQEALIPIICVFGKPDEVARIGRHTLDSFLLEVDLEKRQLVPKVFRLIQHV